MIDFEKTAQLFFEKSIFCFTSDIDWSPEWAIEEMLMAFDKLQAPISIFITHQSEVVKKYYGKKERTRHVGIHPNFLPNSSHGANYIEQIDFCQQLWPDARCFRSHGFFENYQIIQEMRKRGFIYDSNLCLYLQPFCMPLRHWSGLVRFPVFWEDDVHAGKALPFDLDEIKRHLDIPGLKIFNFHPLNFVLNMPTTEYYLEHKFLYGYVPNPADSWNRYIFKGKGEATFVEELITYLKEKKADICYLDDLIKQLPQCKNTEA